MKKSVSKEKFVCPLSVCLPGHMIFARISSQKRKSSRNPFCLFIWGQGRKVTATGKNVANLVTLSLKYET